jgi:hypothetical protein
MVMAFITKNLKLNARQPLRPSVQALMGMVLALAGCASGPVATPLPFYRCEYGIEFTAKFIDDSVALDSVRGYDVLYRSGKPSVYSNPRMHVEFNLGVLGREAIVRYPLLPLVARCVRDN